MLAAPHTTSIRLTGFYFSGVLNFKLCVIGGESDCVDTRALVGLQVVAVVVVTVVVAAVGGGGGAAAAVAVVVV